MSNKRSINDQIKATVVHLILPDGGMKKNLHRKEALRIAEELNLDLVEVGDGENNLPVCKVLDYGKMLYEQKKKIKKRSNNHIIKEIRVSYTISEHDLDIKHKKIKEFLEKGYKVNYVLELHGRYRGLTEEARNKLEKNISEFLDTSSVGSINMSYKSLSVLLSPSS